MKKSSSKEKCAPLYPTLRAKYKFFLSFFTDDNFYFFQYKFELTKILFVKCLLIH